MRTIISSEPFSGKSDAFNERGIWAAAWITHPQVRGQEPAVAAFRRLFSLDKQTQVRIHVSADERYELFLDGQRIGRGPERGDPANWFYETHDLDLGAGPHVIVARMWWMGESGGAPYAQMSIRPGFLLAAEEPFHELLSTGAAAWESKRLSAYEFLQVDQRIHWVGAKIAVHGSRMDWGVEHGKGADWQPVEVIAPAQNASNSNCTPLLWRLRPATLPPMFEQPIQAGEARHVQKIESLDTRKLPVLSDQHLIEEATAWNALLTGRQSLTIPAQTRRRVIVDLGNYFCAYPQLLTSNGDKSIIRIHWAESLFEPSEITVGFRDPQGNLHFPSKGNRDQIDGKIFDGVGDIFYPDGGPQRHFHTLWWEAGRYLEFVIITKDQPLTIEKFWLEETHYPHQPRSRFESSDQRLAQIIPTAMRTLEMCSHETYMDCPYYEQLMYLGDTRLQALTTYAMCGDDRLPRKAIETFDFSRRTSGLTQSRYPSRILQIIPPFSLWWIAMVHDYAMWRNDPDFITARMPGVRAVLDYFLGRLNRDSILGPVEGWNFVDWVDGWADGVAPGANSGISALLNFQLVWVLELAAELETSLGENELAARYRRFAKSIATAAVTAFWTDHRGLFSDDVEHQHFSEHTQCLALLGNSLPSAIRDRVINGLLADTTFSRTTIYFMYYLFEVYRTLGLPQRIIDRLGLWFELKGNGLRTTVEMPEPCRSDCHAWGAHPVFHFFASILGIRPATLGFSTVTIQPQLGPLTWARGSMVHPQGTIRVDFALKDGELSGEVELPPGIHGTLIHAGRRQTIGPGKQPIHL